MYIVEQYKSSSEKADLSIKKIKKMLIRYIFSAFLSVFKICLPYNCKNTKLLLFWIYTNSKHKFADDKINIIK